jgi:Family of unknown function (DUF5335)
MPFIEQDQWKSFLDEFSKRNQSRTTRLEIVGNEVGAWEEEQFLPLIGVSFEPRGSDAGSVVIILGGETAQDQRHVEHLVEQVKRIAPITGVTGLEDGVGFEDRDGNKTLLIFEQLPEIPEDTTSQRTSSRA